MHDPGRTSAEWDTYLAAEPGTARTFDPAGLRKVGKAFADFTDNKSPWCVGHSRQVAGLSYRAALGTRDEEPWCQGMFDTALLHGWVGRTASKKRPLRGQSAN